MTDGGKHGFNIHVEAVSEFHNKNNSIQYVHMRHVLYILERFVLYIIIFFASICASSSYACLCN